VAALLTTLAIVVAVVVLRPVTDQYAAGQVEAIDEPALAVG
jgi:hypothetical protein